MHVVARIGGLQYVSCCNLLHGFLGGGSGAHLHTQCAGSNCLVSSCTSTSITYSRCAMRHRCAAVFVTYRAKHGGVLRVSLLAITSVVPNPGWCRVTPRVSGCVATRPCSSGYRLVVGFFVAKSSYVVCGAASTAGVPGCDSLIPMLRLR